MTQILPWVALALAAAALLARDSRATSDSSEPTSLWQELRANRAMFVAMAAIALLALVSGWRWNDKLAGYMPASWGLVLGLAVAVVAYIAELAQERAIAGASIPMALGLAAVGVTGMGAKDSVLHVQLGFLVGSALGAWMLSLQSAGRAVWWPAIASAFAAAGIGCNFLGAKWPGDKAAQSGTAFGIAAVLAGIAGAGLARAIQRQKGEGEARAGFYVVLAATFLLLGGTIVGQRYLFMNDTWRIFGGSVIAALVVNWFLPDGRSASTFRFLLATVVWIAIATVAFGTRRGYGMSVSLIGGLGMLLLLGNRRALMTMGPVLALVMFRMFTEVYPDAQQAIDIGQHYTVIGLLLGAALPLIPVEWSRILRSGQNGGNTAGAAFLWVILLLGVLPAAAIFLGPKGIIGFVAGLGIGSFVEGLKGPGSLHLLSLGAGFAAAMTVIYGWLGEQLDKTRDEKIGVLYAVVGVLVAIAIVVAALTPRQGEQIEPA